MGSFLLLICSFYDKTNGPLSILPLNENVTSSAVIIQLILSLKNQQKVFQKKESTFSVNNPVPCSVHGSELSDLTEGRRDQGFALRFARVQTQRETLLKIQFYYY